MNISDNPLVAQRTDTTTPLAGTFLLEDGEALVHAIESKDWVAGGLATVSGVLDTAAAVSDPIGTLIAMGLGWLLDHVQPFNTWLEELTGDADQVRAHAQTWKNVQEQMTAQAQAMETHIRADLGSMHGLAIDAYTGAATDVARAISSAGRWAGAMGTALDVAAFIVQVVHDVVRDAIAQVVGSILSYAIELTVTVGTALPLVLEQIATRVASLIGRVGRSVADLVTSARNLTAKLADLESLFKALQDKLDELFRGSNGSHGTPRPDRAASTDADAIPAEAARPRGETSPTSPDWARDDRYIPPTREQQEAFADAVRHHGPSNPNDWIEYDNPNYATQRPEWTQNCGPCSRSFADAYQGGSPIAAHGDRGMGEYDEMWEITGARPNSTLANDGSYTPAGFTSEAYRRLELDLSRESPGTVAIVGVDWDVPGLERGTAGGHWFNAFVDDNGALQWADAQSGTAGPWPPPYPSEIWRAEAIARENIDSPWRGVGDGPGPRQ